MAYARAAVARAFGGVFVVRSFAKPKGTCISNETRGL